MKEIQTVLQGLKKLQQYIRTNKENQKMRDFDIHMYATLKESVKSLELQLENSEYLPIEFVHKLQDTIKQHKRDMTKHEIKYKKHPGTDIPGKVSEDPFFEMIGLP